MPRSNIKVYFIVSFSVIAATVAPTPTQQVMGQQTTNSSNVTNSAAPAASSTTTGGTNINYQTNNAWDTQNGFGPGIFCRTPMIHMGGNWGRAFLDAYDPVQASGNSNINYAVNVGLQIPIASSVLDDCKRLVAAIARDREISSQLSMLRTCAQLKKEGLIVDPEKFPMLSPCVDKSSTISASNVESSVRTPITSPSPIQIPVDQTKPILTPKTNRLL